MKRNFRLTKSNDFKKVRAEGRKQKSEYVVLLYLENELPYSRTAAVASKKIGSAVSRNRTKRVLRSCLVNLWSEIQPGWDIILYARPAVSQACFSEVCTSIENMLKNVNLII